MLGKRNREDIDNCQGVLGANDIYGSIEQGLLYPVTSLVYCGAAAQSVV